MTLHLDDDELASCVGCGLCLPHCPTFRVTGEEALSPRGRIASMRLVQQQATPIDADFVRFMETCVQCRGCEPACPSGVPFGHLMEGTREALASRRRITPWWQRAAYAVLPRHRLLLAGSTLLAVGQRLRVVPKRLGLPPLPVRRGAPVRRSTGVTRVWLFTGCVMDAWQRHTHRNVAAVLEAMSVGVDVPDRRGGCCGALHTHAGLTAAARRLAESVIASMPGDAPIVVDSAGCGAALKDYGHLLGSSDARRFSERVVDVHEFLAARLDLLPPLVHQGAVIVQDPCHLRHVQRQHQAVRTVLAACADIVELDDDGLCCGAGGAYATLQPQLANDIRTRKQAALDRADPQGGLHVVSANPGCAIHLGSVGRTIRHPADVLAAALGAPTSRPQRQDTR